MWLSGEWDKHTRCWASFTVQSKVTGPFFYLCLLFGSEVVVRLTMWSSVFLLPVYYLLHPCWKPCWLKQVLPSIEEQMALVKWNQCAGNEQTRSSSVYSAGNAFHTGANWYELRGMSRDVAVSVMDSGLIFADKTFVICHRNVKFMKTFSRKINQLYGIRSSQCTTVITTV